MNIGLLLPAVFFLNLGCAFAIHFWPHLFVANNRHVWLIAAQVAAFAGYLYYVLRFYAKLAPLIADARAEWQMKREPET